MSSFPWNIITPIIAAIAGLFVGSLKPFMDWHIEKNKVKYQYRKDFLKKAREIVTNPEFYPDEFIDTAEYSQLKPYLSKTVIHNLENRISVIKTGNAGLRVNVTHKILDELVLLEKKWKLL